MRKRRVLSPRAARLAAGEAGGAATGPGRRWRRQERSGRAHSPPGRLAWNVNRGMKGRSRIRAERFDVAAKRGAAALNTTSARGSWPHRRCGTSPLRVYYPRDG